MVTSRLFRSETAGFTINMSRGERHYVVVCGSNAETGTAVFVVSTNSTGVVNVAPIYNGDSIIIDSSEMNKLIVTKGGRSSSTILDIVLQGSPVTVTDIIS